MVDGYLWLAHRFESVEEEPLAPRDGPTDLPNECVSPFLLLWFVCFLQI